MFLSVSSVKCKSNQISDNTKMILNFFLKLETSRPLKQICILPFQFGSQPFGFSIGKRIKALPKTFAVVFVDGVRQFVQNDVIRQMLRQSYQMDAQVDVVGCRATAPARGKIFDDYAPICETVHRG